MFPRLVECSNGRTQTHMVDGAGDPCLLLTSDSRPRLRWTTDLHDRFVDAITQLGGPSKATPRAILRTMSVNGLTLFHLKSHLQKYRLGLSTAYPLEISAPPNLLAPDRNEGYGVKEALRVQMEVQSKLHLQVEVEKRLQICEDAQRRYLTSLLKAACKLFADQIIGDSVTDNEGEDFQERSTETAHNQSVYPSYPANRHSSQGSEEASPTVNPQWHDGSTESCLISHECPSLSLESSSPRGVIQSYDMDLAAGTL